MASRAQFLIPLLAAVFVTACGSSSSTPDGGSLDAGVADAGPADAGAVDAGLDAGVPAADAGANIETEGVWNDNYGNSGLMCAGGTFPDGGAEPVPSWCAWSIDDTLWGEDTVVSYDNTSRTAVTQEYAFSAYDPGTYNTIFWTKPADGGFWWCMAAYDQATYDDALNSPIGVDPTSPWDGGCPIAVDGGDSFAWTYMTPHIPPISVQGEWTIDQDGGEVKIDDTNWGPDSIVWYDNQAGWTVTKATTDAGTATYNQIVWTDPDGGFAFCAVASGLSSAEAAQAATDSATSTNLNTGCGGAPWTQVTGIEP